MKSPSVGKLALRDLFASTVVTLSFLLVSAANAAVLTVGPNGDFSAIQSAIDAAGSNGQGDEIRITEGIYVESISMNRSAEADGLSLSGGWDPTYSQVVGTSTINTAGMGRVLEAISAWMACL